MTTTHQLRLYQTALVWLKAARTGRETFASMYSPGQRPRANLIALIIAALPREEDRELLIDWVAGYPIARKEPT